MKSKIDSFFIKNTDDRICQGDIFRNFTFIDSIDEDNGKKVRNLTLPYMVIISQDCDLDRDFKNRKKLQGRDEIGILTHDKFLHSILVCPAFVAEKVKEGSHLNHMSMVMDKFDSKRWSNLKSNQNQRFHFILGDSESQLPNLVLDFKHHFSINRDVLYNKREEHYIATLNELFREDLSQRFAFYLCRVGVPEISLKTVDEDSIAVTVGKEL